jgi:hypothetical protein
MTKSLLVCLHLCDKDKVFSLHAMFDGTRRLTWQVLRTLSSSLSLSLVLGSLNQSVDMSMYFSEEG